jgi:hypothetical protein
MDCADTHLHGGATSTWVVWCIPAQELSTAVLRLLCRTRLCTKMTFKILMCIVLKGDTHLEKAQVKSVLVSNFPYWEISTQIKEELFSGGCHLEWDEPSPNIKHGVLSPMCRSRSKMIIITIVIGCECKRGLCVCVCVCVCMCVKSVGGTLGVKRIKVCFMYSHVWIQHDETHQVLFEKGKLRDNNMYFFKVQCSGESCSPTRTRHWPFHDGRGSVMVINRHQANS